MKYFFIFILIFFVSCAETTKKTSIESGVLGGKCFTNNTCNTGLICDETTLKCIKQDEGLCANVDCSSDVNSECNIQTGNCDCKSKFHKGVSGVCLFNTKEVSCKKPDIENSEYTDAIVTVEWNKDSSSWNQTPSCDWTCKMGFYKKSEGNGATKEQYTCEPCSCSEWETCSDTGDCSLTEGRCSEEAPCSEGKVCDSNHNCVNPANPCEGVECGKGTCVVSDNNLAFCNCNDNYYDDGSLHCVNPCDGKTCSGHGTCSSTTILDAHCNCDDNYFADGFNCISPCTGHWGCTTDNNVNIDHERTIAPAVPSGGSKGTCTAETFDNPICTCITNYEDPNNDLICTPLDPCNGDCNAWESCNLDSDGTPACKLNPSRCNDLVDCEHNLCQRKDTSTTSPPPTCVCDTDTHYCVPFDAQ